MEIQAAVQMVSREVVTVPRDIPSQRNIAIEISTPTSEPVRSSGAVSLRGDHSKDSSSKCIQTKRSVDVKAIISSHSVQKKKRRTNRRSKSDEEISHEPHIPHAWRIGYQRADRLKYLRKNKCSCKPLKNPKPNPSSKRRNAKLMDSEFIDYKPYLRNPSVYHTEVSCRPIDEDDLADVLEEWLSILPIQPTDYFGRPIEKEYLFYDLFEKLKSTAYHLPEHNGREKIKEDIIRLLNEYPVAVKGCRHEYLSKLADILIENIKSLGQNMRYRKKNFKSNFNSFYNLAMNRYIPPTEGDLRRFLSDELSAFIRKFGIRFQRHALLQLEEELVDVFMVFMETIHTTNDELMGEDIVNVLIEHGFPDHQASHFVHTLIKHLRETFLNETDSAGLVKSEMLVVLPSVNQNPYSSMNSNATENSISAINDSDLNNLMENYTRQLCEQINQWLTSIETLLPRINERGFRQVVVNDLAGDIIDRHRYLEMNPGSKESDEAELEHLKYQIFKWINKLAGEDTLQPGEHAPELMRRIRSIPVPMLSRPGGMQTSRIGKGAGGSCGPSKRSSNDTYSGSRVNTSKRNSDGRNPTIVNTSNTSCTPDRKCVKPTCRQTTDNGPCCPDGSIVTPTTPSREQLNDEYEEYVKSWVQKIPIRATSPEEEALAEKARLGIHNGIWKAITKIRCNPSIFTNRFYFEDVFDEEIEELLNCLPQTPELQAKKHLMKVELIQKTIDTLERNTAAGAASYKQQLIGNVDQSLQKQGLQAGNNSEILAQEEFEIMRIVEQFILYTSYKDDDPMKSEVYRKRMLKEIKDLIEEIKKHQPQNQDKFNFGKYMTDILDALSAVPKPNDNTMRDEVNNILLEFEIEKWFTDLPVMVHQDNTIQLLQWKKKLDNLAQRIGDVESNASSYEGRERGVRAEIQKFLERVPFQDENINKNFMIDELVNRLKNRDQLNQSKRVAFHEPGTYDEFRSNIPFSSSLNRIVPGPGEQAANEDRNRPQDSLALRNPSRSLGASDVDYGAFAQERPKSSTFRERTQRTLATIHDESQGPDESNISYQGFAGQGPPSSTFRNRPDQSFSPAPNASFGNASDITYGNFAGRQPLSSTMRNNEGSFGANASDVNYDSFAGRKPLSSTARNEEESYVTPPRHADMSISAGEYRDFSQARPLSSTLNQSLPREERAFQPSGIPHRSFPPYAQDRQQPDQRSHRTHTAGMKPEVSDCCKAQRSGGSPQQQLSPGADSSGMQRLETPQPGRFQRESQGVSRGIVFKDTDASHKPQAGPQMAHVGPLLSCQTCSLIEPSQEVGEPQVSQSGHQRTIATNTKKKITCTADDLATLVDVNDDGEIKCRCIERFLRCKKWLQQIDGLEKDLPPCLPLMYTCPCFL